MRGEMMYSSTAFSSSVLARDRTEMFWLMVMMSSFFSFRDENLEYDLFICHLRRPCQLTVNGLRVDVMKPRSKPGKSECKGVELSCLLCFTLAGPHAQRPSSRQSDIA